MAPATNSYSTGAGKCLVIKIKSRKKAGFSLLTFAGTDPEKEVEDWEKR